jgi:hypothetical protein
MPKTEQVARNRDFTEPMDTSGPNSPNRPPSLLPFDRMLRVLGGALTGGSYNPFPGRKPPPCNTHVGAAALLREG